MSGRILSVAESDSSGGGGVQSDIKTAMAFGCYASSAITAVNAQNSSSVIEDRMMDCDIIVKQMRSVLDDVGADVIKIGFLGREDAINAVSDVLDEIQGDDDYRVLVDPCVVSRDGRSLLDSSAIATLKRRLLLRANIVTPNRWEAELLTGVKIKDIDSMRHAAEMMITFGAEAVVLKGWQLTDKSIVNLIISEDVDEVIETPFIDAKNTHGAGSTLSAGIAVGLAQGLPLIDSVKRAINYLNNAIINVEDFGGNVSYINHGHGIF